jgi:hypothetical protein
MLAKRDTVRTGPGLDLPDQIDLFSGPLRAFLDENGWAILISSRQESEESPAYFLGRANERIFIGCRNNHGNAAPNQFLYEIGQGHGIRSTSQITKPKSLA